MAEFGKYPVLSAATLIRAGARSTGSEAVYTVLEGLAARLPPETTVAGMFAHYGESVPVSENTVYKLMGEAAANMVRTRARTLLPALEPELVCELTFSG